MGKETFCSDLGGIGAEPRVIPIVVSILLLSYCQPSISFQCEVSLSFPELA